MSGHWVDTAGKDVSRRREGSGVTPCTRVSLWRRSQCRLSPVVVPDRLEAPRLGNRGTRGGTKEETGGREVRRGEGRERGEGDTGSEGTVRERDPGWVLRAQEESVRPPLYPLPGTGNHPVSDLFGVDNETPTSNDHLGPLSRQVPTCPEHGPSPRW